MNYLADLDSTHWTLIAVAVVSTAIAIVQFISQPELRALWADVRARLLIDDLQNQDEKRLRELGVMDGWQPRSGPRLTYQEARDFEARRLHNPRSEKREGK